MKKFAFLLVLVSIFMAEQSFGAKVISIGTAPSGGAWYGIGGALADVITKNVEGVTAIAEVTGAAVENVKLLGTKKIEIGFTINALAEAGFEGKPPFKERYDNIRTLVSSIQEGYLQIVALKGSGLKYVSDLKGKRVAVGPAGHGSLIRLKEIFQILGFGFSFDQIDPVYLPYSQSLTALGDRRVDATVLYVAPPAPAIKAFCVNHDIELLALKEENRQAALKKYPHYMAVEIPAGIYKGVDKPIPTVATANVIIVDAGLDEGLVYNITKAIFENIDRIRAGHPSAKGFSLDVATKGSAVPFHPGAIRYFKERGVWSGN
jgi:TRAP transporter TAXI family solute receptor